MTYSKSLALLPRLDLGVDLKLSGVGFRLFTHRQRLVLNLGYSHYLCVLGRARGRRQRLHLPSSRADLRCLRRSDPYRGRGIQKSKFPPVLKEGKKR